MFHSIKNIDDINNFLNETNSLHDGYIIGVNYSNNGISKIEGGHYIEPEKTKLTLQILVTSIWDTVVEIEFDNLFKWQLKVDQMDIAHAFVFINNKNLIVWTDDSYTSEDAIKEGSYIIAESMKWRIVK